MRRGVLSILGSTLDDLLWLPCQYRPIRLDPPLEEFRGMLRGRRIERVDRLGKRLLICLDDSACLAIEPRMSGLVLLSDPPDLEHLRLRFLLRGGPVKELLYWDRRGLGVVRLLNTEQFLACYGPEKVGPDALETTPELLSGQLKGSRRSIKVALLDQKGIAGVGNLYASEALHLAGIHPTTPCDRLTPKQWTSLHEALIEILQAAIDKEGSTLSDGTYRNALNQNGRYQNHHRVYDKAGSHCPTCQQEVILRIVQAQRSTFFCPSCQPKAVPEN